MATKRTTQTEQQPDEEIPRGNPEEQPVNTEEEQVEETEGDPDPQKVCATCGEPATYVSSSEAYSAAYYCDKHSTEAQRNGEGTKPINPKDE